MPKNDDKRYRVTVEFTLPFNCNSVWADASDIGRDVAALVYQAMGTTTTKPGLEEKPKYLQLCIWGGLRSIEEIGGEDA
jgi:hypothetical protein